MGLLKKVSLESVPVEIVLIARGLGCVFMSLFLAYKNNFSLIPRQSKLQLARILVAGLGLGPIITSYQFINASTVAVVFKFDVIFLLFISMFFKGKFQRLAFHSLGALLLLLAHILYFKEPYESTLGYMLSLGGTFVISIGFILLNKSGKNENQAVTCLVPGASILLFGIIILLARRGDYSSISETSFALALSSGIVMFFIYIYTLKLYKKHTVIFTELLTFACIILFIPIEIWGLKIPISFRHLFSILVIAAYTLFIYLKKEDYSLAKFVGKTLVKRNLRRHYDG